MLRRFIGNIASRIKEKYPYEVSEGDIVRFANSEWKVVKIKRGAFTREVYYELVGNNDRFEEPPF